MNLHNIVKRPINFYTSFVLLGGLSSTTALIWFGSASISRLVTK